MYYLLFETKVSLKFSHRNFPKNNAARGRNDDVIERNLRGGYTRN